MLVGGVGCWWELLGDNGGRWEGMGVGRRGLGLMEAHGILPVS